MLKGFHFLTIIYSGCDHITIYLRPRFNKNIVCHKIKAFHTNGPVVKAIYRKGEKRIESRKNSYFSFTKRKVCDMEKQQEE